MTGQNFSGPVAQAIQADSVSQTHHHHSHGRLLTGQERVELNNMVKRLDEVYHEPGWKTWKFMHRTIGVESIDEMCIGHRDQATAILQLLLDNAELRAKPKPAPIAPPTPKPVDAGQLDQLKRANDFQLKQISELSRTIDSLRGTQRDLERRLSSKESELQSSKQSLDQAQKINAGLASQHAVAGAATNKAKRRLLIVTLCAFSSVAAGAYFAMQSGQLDASLRSAEAQMEQCNFAGKRYPAGSIVSLSDGNDLRCELPKDKAMAGWVEVKPEKPKKNAAAKRKPRVKQSSAEPEQQPDIEVNGERLF